MKEYIKIPNIFKRDITTKKLIEGEYEREEFKYLKGLQWYATEKIDGTNIRVFWDGYRVSLAGRNEKSLIPKELMQRLEEIFLGESNEELFEGVFGTKQVILYGEGYGGKIQGNNGYGDYDFILFDVMIDGCWLSRENVIGIAEALGIKVVPVMGIGTLPEIVEWIKNKPMSLFREREVEGFVCKPVVPMYYRNGEPITVKVKCRDFGGKA